MNCESYEAEMYFWRPGCDAGDFKQLFEHLAACPACARRFAQISEADVALHQTIHHIPEAPALEQHILAGLAHDRLQAQRRWASWKRWALPPIAAMLLATLSYSFAPYVREARLGRQVAALMDHPPAAVIDSTDQAQLLAWSAAALHDFSGLPPELKKVTFRAARTLEVERYPAVLLDMKNERRASLLIVNGLLTRDRSLRSFHDDKGSHSRWSDGQRTYILLFHGNEQDMRAYMQQMGIAT